MKRVYVVGLLMIFVLTGGGVFIAYRMFSRSFDFAQEQAAKGRIYMTSMQDADHHQAGTLAKELMLEPPGENGWKTLANPGVRDVPSKWKAHGVTSIRYRPDWVSFGWHGGPFAHTSLEVRKMEDGRIKFTAHYSDNEPEKELRVVE